MRAALAAALALAACRATAPVYPADPGPYDALPADALQAARTVRTHLDEADPEDALGEVEPLIRAHPESIPLRILRQEAEIAALGDQPAAKAAAALFPRYLARAEREDAVPDWILAARLAPTADDARVLLDKAERLDPGCVWVPYARAFGAYAERDFSHARNAVDKALRIDGGHMPSRRLQATLLASSGDVAQAIPVLRDWLRDAADDSFVGDAAAAEAQVDLAALHVLDGHPGKALALLDVVRTERLASPARAELVRAVALDTDEEPDQALAAASRAAALDPGGLLPLVQEAILHRNEGDAEEERAAWERLLARIDTLGGGDDEGGTLDFGALLLRLLGHVRLERLERASQRAAEAKAAG